MFFSRPILKVIVTAFMFTDVVQLNALCWFMLVCESVNVREPYRTMAYICTTPDFTIFFSDFNHENGLLKGTQFLQRKTF